MVTDYYRRACQGCFAMTPCKISLIVSMYGSGKVLDAGQSTLTRWVIQTAPAEQETQLYIEWSLLVHCSLPCNWYAFCGVQIWRSWPVCIIFFLRIRRSRRLVVNKRGFSSVPGMYFWEWNGTDFIIRTFNMARVVGSTHQVSSQCLCMMEEFEFITVHKPQPERHCCMLC